MRTLQEFDEVKKLSSEGKNNCEIYRITGIPRCTVRDWVNKPPKFFLGNTNLIRTKSSKDLIINNNLFHECYSYILGLYLGDGYINKSKRTYRLRIALDKKYENLNNYAKIKLKQLFPNNTIGTVNCKGCINLSVYNKELSNIFPQHSVGKKHNRFVGLVEWQQKIINYLSLLKGFIHSDGCFYEENIKGYHYERYAFSNKSIDIIELFKSACNFLEIDYNIKYLKQIYNIRISKKESVAKLKMLIGTKEKPL